MTAKCKRLRCENVIPTIWPKSLRVGLFLANFAVCLVCFASVPSTAFAVPVVTTNNPLVVPNGGMGVIRTTNLETMLGSPPYIYDLLSIPINGTLFRSGVPLVITDTFSQLDIDSNIVSYTHDGTLTLSDSFDFDVNDSDVLSTGRTTFSIQVLERPATDISEPGTLAILGLGLAGLGFMRRRKKLN